MTSKADAQLVAQYVSDGSEDAFAALAGRHIGMVYRACLRILRDTAEAEDAAQATFILLASKAGSISRREAVAGWLYGAARLIAGRHLRAGARRRKAEEKAALEQQREASTVANRSDRLRGELDDAMARLSKGQRDALVLVYLEGRSQSEAARDLGVPVGTVKSRVSVAIRKLRDRLSRRGIVLGASALAALLAEESAGAAPAGLAAKAASLASANAAGLGATVDGAIRTMVQGTAKALLWAKIKTAVVIMSATIAAGALMGILYVTALRNGQPSRPGPLPKFATARLVLDGNHGGVRSVAYSPDGAAVAAGYWDGTVCAWGLPAGDEAFSVRFENRRSGSHMNAVLSVQFSPDGGTLASGFGDGTVRLLDPMRGLERIRMDSRAGPVYEIEFSPDGRALASASQWGVVSLWDTVTGKEHLRIKTGSTFVAVAFSPDGNLLAWPGRREIHIRDMRTGEERPTLKGHERPMRAVVFSPDGKTLASGSFDGTIRLWDVESGSQMLEIPAYVERDYTVINFPAGVCDLVFSPDGRMLASASRSSIEPALRVWDVSTGKELLHFPVESCHAIAFSPDGGSLVSTWGYHVCVWDLDAALRARGAERRPKP